MADAPNPHQDALRRAVDGLGVKPHRLRFLRADRAPQTWKPTQAARALSRFTFDRRHPGWRVLTLANALCAAQGEIADQASLQGSNRAIRPTLVRGMGTTQALLFCDGSALVGRHVVERNGMASLLFWPGIAQIRVDSTKIGKHRFARVEALAGHTVPDVRLRVFAGGEVTLWDVRATWDKHTDTAQRCPALADLQEAIGRIVDALPHEPVAAVPVVGPPGTAIDEAEAVWYNRPQWAGMASTYPAWLPHRWVDPDTIAERQTRAIAALVWFAVGARADKAVFEHADKWSIKDKHWHEWSITVSRGKDRITYPVEAVIAHPNTPPEVRKALYNLAICSEGFSYEIGSSERLGSPKAPNVGTQIGTPPPSAHQKMQAVQAFGPSVDWWPDA